MSAPPSVSFTSTATTISNTLRLKAWAPKSPNAQISTCAPCRTRRLRCNLQDLPPSTLSNSPCSNCIRRGSICAYTEIESTKRHRRGRRARQVEAIYGKIPALKREFFTCTFWTWFCIQHPVLDPIEFSQRYIAHIEGKNIMCPEGVILAKLLVVWAASFGLDESGSSIKHDFKRSDAHQVIKKNLMLTINFNSKEAMSASNQTQQHGKYRGKKSINVMLKQILELISSCGILRRPTLDGVRVLLLVAPLMEDSPYQERAVIHEAAFSHSRIFHSASSTSESDTFTRIFIYAYIQGITTALKCGYPTFRSEDINNLGKMVNLLTDEPSISTASQAKLCNQMMQLISMPLRLSSIWCKLHSVIISFKATRRVEEYILVKSNGMPEIWQEFRIMLDEIFCMKRDAIAKSQKESEEHLSDTWLILIFECYVWISEYLKHLAFGVDLFEYSPPTLASCPLDLAYQPLTYLPSLSLSRLFLEARMHCVQLLPHVLRIIRYHLKKGSSGDMPSLFAWDAGLIGDGCFYAGLLAADLYRDFQCLGGHDSEDEGEGNGDCISPEEGVNLTLSALAEMHWVFSKCEERIATIRSTLQRSKEKTIPNAVLNCPMDLCVAPLTPQQGGPAPDMLHDTESNEWIKYSDFTTASSALVLSSQSFIALFSPYEDGQVQDAFPNSCDAQLAAEVGSNCFISGSFRPDTFYDFVDYIAPSVPDTFLSQTVE